MKPSHFRDNPQCYFCVYMNGGKSPDSTYHNYCDKHEFEMCAFDTENMFCDDFKRRDY